MYFTLLGAGCFCIPISITWALFCNVVKLFGNYLVLLRLALLGMTRTVFNLWLILPTTEAIPFWIFYLMTCKLASFPLLLGDEPWGFPPLLLSGVFFSLSSGSSDPGCGLCSGLLHVFLILDSGWWSGCLGHLLCMAEGWSARVQVEKSLFGTDQFSVQFTCHWPMQVP